MGIKTVVICHPEGIDYSSNLFHHYFMVNCEMWCCERYCLETLTSESLQSKTKVLIRKGKVRLVEPKMVFVQIIWWDGGIGQEFRSLKMGQERLLFPNPNLCPWTSYFTPVCFSILTYEIRIIMALSKGCDEIVINWYMWTTYNSVITVKPR